MRIIHSHFESALRYSSKIMTFFNKNRTIKTGTWSLFERNLIFYPEVRQTNKKAKQQWKNEEGGAAKWNNEIEFGRKYFKPTNKQKNGQKKVPN